MNIENRTEVNESWRKFKEHLSSSIIYPERKSHEHRLNIVPIDIIVSPRGILQSVTYHEHYPVRHSSYRYATENEFVKEAMRIATSFNGWVAEKVDGAFRETSYYKEVKFFYHKRALEDRSIVLNPDVRPRYPDVDSWRYKNGILAVNGCDGEGEVLAIVDEEGELQEVECLICHGKTNQEMVIGMLLQMGKWEAAVYQGKKVKTQMELIFYT